MKQELISKEKNLETIKLSYEVSEFQPIVTAEINKASNDYQIPGFRKGKAPKGLIRKMLGEERLRAIALEELLGKSVNEIVKKKETLLFPNIENVEYDDDGNAQVTLKIHLKPDLQLPDYKDIVIDKFVANEENINDMVNERLKQLRESNAIYEPKDGTAQFGDGVRMSYVVTNEEGKELYNQEPKEYDLFEDDKRDIIQNCVGMKANEEKEYDKTFPAEADGNTSGKEVSFSYKLKVEEVYKRITPELNDDFAKEVKEVAGETLEEMKSNIRQEAMDAFDETIKNALKNQIINALIDDSEIELSEETKKEFLNSSIESMKKDNSYDTEREKHDSDEEFFEEIVNSNIRQLKRMYAIAKVFEETGEESTDERFKEYVEKMAPSWGMSSEQALGFIEKDQDVRSRLAESLMQDAVSNYLMDKCTIEEKELPTKEEEVDAQEEAEKIIAEVEKTAEKIEKENKE